MTRFSMAVFELVDLPGGAGNCLSLDGEGLPGSSGSYLRDHTLRGTFWGESIRRIGALSLEGFLPQFSSLTVNVSDCETASNWKFTELALRNYNRRAAGSSSVFLQFPVQFELEHWAMPYSISQCAA